jgi:HlyD family secretion protein
MNKKYLLVALLLVLLAFIFIFFKPFGKTKEEIKIETARISRGEISDIITATGTLEALETVEVGTQVSGVIENIFVDYNSLVSKGQLLAKIDETPLVASLEQSLASVESAEAEVDYQKANYDRYKVMSDKKLIAQSDFDLVEYNYKKANASLKNAKLLYEKNKINLSYATIFSPIDGIILDRAVEEGQTVAASFNTPTLFTIANDLTQMQVEASVDEADIGRLKVGQRVEFTVDAFPDMKFDGELTEIRLQPVESSNVITYTVVIDAPNPEKKLMPGMTANVSFYVTEKKNIVFVPSKALKINPNPDLMKSYKEQNPEVEFELPNPPGPGSERMSEEKPEMVWVKTENIISVRPVELGDTDELYYEVLSGLEEGDEVIVALSSESGNNNMQEPPKGESQSPFMPPRPGQNRKK